MTTPLIFLAILVVPLIGAKLPEAMLGRKVTLQTVGAWAFAGAFLFFAVGHFVKTDGMVEMLPPAVPGRTMIVYATGILEVILAIGLMAPRTGSLAGTACIIVLVCFFPANIYAALNRIGLGGHKWGGEYLLIRTPLQIFLVFGHTGSQYAGI